LIPLAASRKYATDWVAVWEGLVGVKVFRRLSWKLPLASARALATETPLVTSIKETADPAAKSVSRFVSCTW